MSITEVQFQATAVHDAPAQAIEGRSQWHPTWRRLRNDKVAVISVIVIGLVIPFPLAAALIAHATGHGVDAAFPNTGEDASGQPVGPGTHGFLIGTDEIGRDLLVRIAYGARISLFVGILTTAIATVAGVSIGLIAGYFGGLVDTVLARVIDAALAFPFIVLALALAAVFHASLAFNLLGDGIRDAMDPRTERIFAGSKASRRKRGKRRGQAGQDADLGVGLVVPAGGEG